MLTFFKKKAVYRNNSCWEGSGQLSDNEPKRRTLLMPKKSTTGDLTQTLVDLRDESPEKAMEKLMPLVYDNLRAIAANYLKGERRDHTLQPTALVHEAFMKLVDQTRVNWQGRAHFYAVCAAAMRRILIDHARGRKRHKRGGGRQRVQLDDALGEKAVSADLVELNDALEALAALDPEQERIVELRFFGGMTVDEVAEVLGVSKRKVEADWTHAKAWLRAHLSPEAEP